MIRSWLSIAGACALGALIGTLAALEISTRFQYGHYFWGIGALLGGIVAYVAVDFRHFCAGVANSYHKTITWRPYGLWWRALGSAYVAVAATIPTILIGMAIILGLLLVGPDPKMPAFTLLGVFFYTPLIIITLTLFATLFLGTITGLGETARGGQEPEKWEEKLRGVIEMNWDLARIFNPVAVSILVIRLSLRGLRYEVAHAPETAMVVGLTAKELGKTLGMFIAGVFVYVHSKRRTICFVDAALGAAIGYTFGSAIVGAVAGAVLGVINYEVVSVRWLKLVPAKATTN